MKVKSRHDWTNEQKADLVKRALAKDETAIPDLIDAYIPMAMKTASWHAYKIPKKMDDIFAAGLEGLVKACTRACTGHLKDEHLDKYIKSIVRWNIREFLRRDVLIPIPHREFKKRIEKWAKSDELHPNVPIDTTKGFKTDTGGTLTEATAIIVSLDAIRDDLEKDLQHSDETMNAIEDLFSKLGLSERECEITSLRMADYTLQEIGEKMGYTKMRIKQILDEVKVKIRKAGFKVSEAKITGTKVCTKCDTEKSLSDYYKRSDNHGETHKSICKQCMKEAREAKCVVK